MIFVTVGTHEQPFNRLIQEVDRLKMEGILTDEVFIQTGYSDYRPISCAYRPFLSYAEMESYMDQADIIICHGGPATFMAALSKGKKVLVVPRRKIYNEHVNDHQTEFVSFLKDHFQLLVVNEVTELANQLSLSTAHPAFASQNQVFCKRLIELLEKGA